MRFFASFFLLLPALVGAESVLEEDYCLAMYPAEFYEPKERQEFLNECYESYHQDLGTSEVEANLGDDELLEGEANSEEIALDNNDW